LILKASPKIYADRAALVQALEPLRRAGKRIAFTNGCFDLVHAGHVQTLRHARALGDCLVVGLNDDASVTRLKGPGRPIFPLEQRAIVVAAFEFVDFVVPFSEDTPAALIEAIRPDALAKGGDYRLDQIVGHDAVKGWGGRVEAAPLAPGISTRRIIEMILERFGHQVAQLPDAAQSPNVAQNNLQPGRHDAGHYKTKGEFSMAEIKTTEPKVEFEVGDQVRHPQFGIGTVLYKYGEGENLKLDIVFAEEGQKKILVKYAKMKKVTDPTADAAQGAAGADGAAAQPPAAGPDQK